jgi:putative toxin of predicted polymorphic toxin system
MDDIELYRSELTRAKEDLRKSLAGGTDLASTTAIARRTCEIMDSDLKGPPQSVLFYDHVSEQGISGPSLWRIKSRDVAAQPFEHSDPSAWQQKNNEYFQLIERIRQRQALPQLFKDPKRGIAYLVEENDRVRGVLADIMKALSAWVVEHGSDADFLTSSAQSGLARMLDERQDLLAALRFAQTLPKDATVSPIPVDRPAVFELAEAAVGLIPVVGTAVALLEAVTGEDLFGYQLDPIDRAILAGGCLLPAAARLFREGKALYTASRMTRLYGRDAAEWSLAFARGERLASDSAAVRTIRRADEIAKARQQIDKQFGKDLVEAFERMGLKNARTSKLTSMPDYLANALKGLIRNKLYLAELDELALKRVVDKGPNLNLMKGQLLEELLESRISAWLRNPAGAVALGISRPPNGLQFIPGHLIRDAAGRQITDGILAHWVGGDLHIVAVFEAKAGASAARELSLASSSISKLSRADRTELRAYARDIFRSRRARATRMGVAFPERESEIDEMISKIEGEVILSEKGGQIRRDAERMAANEDGTLAKLLIGSELTSVKISPTQTKFFGVLPKNVPIGNMESDLQQLGYRFEVLGMNVTDKELIELTQILRPATETP